MPSYTMATMIQPNIGNRDDVDVGNADGTTDSEANYKNTAGTTGKALYGFLGPIPGHESDAYGMQMASAFANQNNTIDTIARLYRRGDASRSLQQDCQNYH